MTGNLDLFFSLRLPCGVFFYFFIPIISIDDDRMVTTAAFLFAMFSWQTVFKECN